MRVLFILGTRPEAIKLAPVVHALSADARFDARVCATAQHRAMLDQVLEAFAIRPHHDLNVMTPGQTLFQSTARILAALEPVLEKEDPQFVFVQGDTTTAFCGALAAFYKNVPVCHVEAGLRTGDLREPFPEEMNRVLVSRLASLHFAPTPASAANLLTEGIAKENVFVTGNTVIDAVLEIRDALANGRLKPLASVANDAHRKLILVTAHRRESFGEGFEEICEGLRRIAAHPDAEVIYPVHPNPNVRSVVEARLRNVPNIRLIEPLDYVSFVDLMRRAHVLLTDSGGIQEEGPSLGKPVLVMRDKTERPEAVHAGTARLVGTSAAAIFSETALLLDNAEEYSRRAQILNPYGDGHAASRIRDLLLARTRLNAGV